MWVYAWRELTRRRSRSMLTILTVLVASALLTSVAGVLRVLNAGVQQVFEAAGADMTIQTVGEPGPYGRARLARHLGPLPESAVARIAALPGVAIASGQLHFWAWKEQEQLMSAVAGLRPDEAARIGPLASEVRLLAGRLLQAGDRGVAVVDQRYADRWNVGLGEDVELAGRRFKVVGIVMPDSIRAAQAEVYVPLADAQEVMAAEQPSMVRGATVNTILVRVADLAALGAVEAQARRIVDDERRRAGPMIGKVVVNTASRVFEQATGVSVLARRAAQAVAALVLVGAILIVFRTALGSVIERTAEIGVLRACGWRHRDVTRLLLLELTIQGALGAAVGLALGETIVYAWSRAVVLTIPNAMNPFPCVPSIPMPTTVAAPFVALPALTIGIFLGVLVICAIGAILAARRAAALEPLAALRRI